MMKQLVRSPLHAAALIALSFLMPLITLRIFPFVAPNEEPKWAALAIFGALASLAVAVTIWRAGRLPLPRHPALAAAGLFLLLAFVGVFIGVNRVEGWIRFSAWAYGALLFGIMFVFLRQMPEARNWLARAIVAAGLAFALGYWKGYFVDYGKPGYNISVLFSPVGHVNFTADVLVVLLPAWFWALGFLAQPIWRVLAWFVAFSGTVVLLVGASRGGMGGLALGLFAAAGIAVLRFRASGRPKPLRAGAAWWLVSAAAASIVVYFALPFHYREAARLSGTLKAAREIHPPEHLTPGVAQPPLAKLWAALHPVLGKRTPMYASSLAMALDRPWLGHGTGNFAWIYPNYSNRFPDFRDPLSSDRTFTTNPHNSFLQIATENGLFAAILFHLLLLWLWWSVLRAARQSGEGFLFAGVVGITAAGFDAQFNHVFFNPGSIYAFMLMAGAWLGRASVVLDWNARAIVLPGAAARLVAVAIALGGVLLAIWPLRWVASEYHVGKAMLLERNPRLLAQAAREYALADRLDPENFRAVFGVATSAYRRGNWSEAEAVLRRFLRIYPYNPPALNLLGASLMLQGKLQEAERVFEEALRVYPGYKLAEENLLRLRLWRQRQPPSRR